ncbi:MAG: hypothetical protein R3B69_00535 [Candidatus Paceibacterota bacterium]
MAAAGTQLSTVRASSSDVYVGGQFVVTEASLARNVTDITITESGTVDATTYLNNIRLYYDLDTSAPYDCASESYSGAESTFGATDTNGFSGANGVSSFSDSVSITPTQALCLYPVMDVLKDAADGATIELEISNPAGDLLVTGGVVAKPNEVVALDGTTTIVDSDLTQTHYHWRNDNGLETTATSRTSGNQDTPLSSVLQEVPVRLRFGVSNEGSTTSVPTTFRLEYAPTTETCDLATGWVDVGATDDDWNLYDSTFLVNGLDTTDIANGSGGVDNENSVFLSSNGGQRDTTSETGALTLATNNWVELEYAIVASTTASEGTSYCFRLTDQGETLGAYNNYPRTTVAADVRVAATGTQVASVGVGAKDFHIGGAFTIKENTSSRNVTSITIGETGTADGTSDISSTTLYYDLDTSAPYDCASESYNGAESTFGTHSLSLLLIMARQHLLIQWAYPPLLLCVST